MIRLSTEEIQVNVIHKAVGQISESDVVLAAASNAIIVGFQVRPSLAARKNAEKEGVEIRLYSIIYDAIEEVKSAMEGMLSPEIKEEITAYVEVLQTFKISKVGTVAGCMVKEGKIKRTVPRISPKTMASIARPPVRYVRFKTVSVSLSVVADGCSVVRLLLGLRVAMW